MSKMYIFRLGVCIATLLAFLSCVAQAGRDVSLPMCSEAKGFASEMNDRFIIPVEHAPLEREAIVLIVRVFPPSLGFLTQKLIQINATVQLATGPTVSVLSDDNGVVILSSVKVGTNIDIHINRVRKDGPVPFRFWSYHANNPSCHIDVSSSSSFYAPIPESIGELATPASVYFKSAIPNGAHGFMITSSFSEGGNVQIMETQEQKNGLVQKIGEVIPWSSGTVFFVYTPKLTGSKILLLEIGIVWTESTNGTPLPTQNPSNSPKAGNDTVNKPESSNSPKGEDTSNGTGKSNGKGHGFALFFLVFLTVVSYFVIMSVVNYRLKGVKQFPEMVPHIEFFRTCSQFASLVKGSVRQGDSRGGYQNLNREEISTDNI